MHTKLGGGGRIEYIDAMRGFSMILVVFGHVLLMMGFPTNSTILGSILLTFRMPLFFFVSGFFAYRTMDKWTSKLTKSVLKRKVQAQIVCTLVFYSIFQLCHSQSPLLFLNNGFSWFWFTIVLFQMFIIYLIAALLEHKFKKPIVPGFLIVTALILFFIHVKYPSQHFRAWIILEWYYLTEYFQFFVFGVLVRKYYQIFLKFIEKDSAKTVIILSYIILLFCVYGFDGKLSILNSSIYNLFNMVLVRYAGLLTIFILFSFNQKYFSDEYKPARWLRLVGRRTLDVYMLHVFVLPNLIFLKPYLEGPGMLLSQLTIGIIASIINIAVCLFISLILRSSNILSQWLFGEKSRTTLSQTVLMP